MKAVRAAIGPGKSIMIDCGVRNSWSLMDSSGAWRAFESTASTGSRALGHDDPLGYAQLKAAVTSKIAYGEREYQVQESTASSRRARATSSGSTRAASAASRASPARAIASRSSTGARPTRTPGRPRSTTARASRSRGPSRSATKLEEQPFKGPMQDDLIGGAFVHENGTGDPQGHGLGIEVDESVVAAGP